MEASDRERVEAESASSGSASGVVLSLGHPSADTVETLISTSDTSLCTWIECSSDKRTWAEVLEEEGRVGGRNITGQPSTQPKCSSPERAPEDTGVPRRETKSHRRLPRERETTKYDVCEVFSPPRICTAAKGQGLRGGWSIDMTFRDPSLSRTYDLRKPKDQGEVKRLIRRDCPAVLVMSPPCTAFSIANQGEVSKQTLEGGG